MGVKMAKNSKLQETEIPIRHGDAGMVFITLVLPERKLIQVVGPFGRFVVGAEEAFTIGKSLVDYAVECGVDEDDGEFPRG
jgi:hypothetical protein